MDMTSFGTLPIGTTNPPFNTINSNDTSTTWTATLPFHGILHYSTAEPPAPAGDKLYKSEIDLFQYTNKLYKNVIIRFDPKIFSVSVEPGVNQWKANGAILIKDIIAGSKKFGGCILVSNGSSTNKSDRKLCCSNYRNRSQRNRQPIDVNTPPRKLCKVHLLLDYDQHSFFLRCGMGFATHTGHMRNEKINDNVPRTRTRKPKAASAKKKVPAPAKHGIETAASSNLSSQSYSTSSASAKPSSSHVAAKNPAIVNVAEVDTSSRLSKYLNYDDLLAGTTTTSTEDHNSPLLSPSVIPPSTIPLSNLFNTNVGTTAVNYSQLLSGANNAAAFPPSAFPHGFSGLCGPVSSTSPGVQTMTMPMQSVPNPAQQPVSYDFLSQSAPSTALNVNALNALSQAMQSVPNPTPQPAPYDFLSQSAPSAALNANALNALSQANFSTTDVFSNPLIAAALNTLTSGNYSSSPSAAAAAALDLFSQFTQGQSGPSSG